MELTAEQKHFIKQLFKNEDYAGWKNIAESLINKGFAIVAGTTCIWYGGIGNFIKTEEAPEYVDCLKYTFDVEEFISSEYFKDIRDNYLKIRIAERDLLNKEIYEIERL